MYDLVRLMIFAVLAIAVVFAFAAPTFAAEAWSTPTFAATFFQDIAGNRAKIVQLSIVFVLIGIALLFKK